jgi:CID domain
VLRKYLISYAKAQATLRTEDGNRIGNGNGETSVSTSCRRRLHILYLLNDLLHHTKYHTADFVLFSTFSASIQPCLVDLVQLASLTNRAKTRWRINNLLQVWEEEAYFSKEYVDKLREAATRGLTGAADDLPGDRANSTGQYLSTKEQPFTMPASHGDPSTLYHDLPAGNMMPHIMPNKSIPIRPDNLRALQFVAGPADDALVLAVKDFMDAAAKIDSNNMDVQSDEGIVEDVDELGQSLLRDVSGDPVGGLTYYGWSREFCEKMKSRNGKNYPLHARGRSYSSSRNSSRSRSPRKRRRYSNSPSDSYASSLDGRSRSRHRSPYRTSRINRREYTPPPKDRHETRSPYSPPYQPIMTQSETQTSQKATFHQVASQSIGHPRYPIEEGIPPPPSIYPPDIGINPNAFPPPSMGLGMGPGNHPIPPPPPNYSGPWPPPPPLPLPLPSNKSFTMPTGMQPSHTPQGLPKPSTYQGGQQQHQHHHYREPDRNRWQR